MTRRNSAFSRGRHHNRRAFLQPLAITPAAERPPLSRRTIVTLAAGLVASGMLITTMWMSMALR